VHGREVFDPSHMLFGLAWPVLTESVSGMAPYSLLIVRPDLFFCRKFMQLLLTSDQLDHHCHFLTHKNSAADCWLMVQTNVA